VIAANYSLLLSLCGRHCYRSCAAGQCGKRLIRTWLRRCRQSLQTYIKRQYLDGELPFMCRARWPGCTGPWDRWCRCSWAPPGT
jgi:hypothetical protein